jgi:hypothetical protein
MRSSVRETAASLSLGLIRPALSSLRLQMDLTLTCLYFKDHNVEWELVNRTGEGFKLKRELLDYMANHHARFHARLSLLKGIATRTELEPYKLLSAHIHGQSQPVLPIVNDLKEIVDTPSKCLDCTRVVYDVSEYLNDVLLSIYASSWQALPKEILTAAEARFESLEQKKAFFT